MSTSKTFLTEKLKKLHNKEVARNLVFLFQISQKLLLLQETDVIVFCQVCISVKESEKKLELFWLPWLPKSIS